MSYFDPSQDIEQIFLNFQRQSYNYPSKDSSYKDLNLDLNLDFDEQQFNYIFQHKTGQNTPKTQQPEQNFKVIIKQKRISKPRYEKNICGYILKKVFRAFVSESYKSFASNACLKHGANFNQARRFCLDKMEKLNGISHLYLVLMPTTKYQVAGRLAMAEFTQWFVRQRYLRHLIFEGKMSNRKIYIDFKNVFFPKEIKRLMVMIEQFTKVQSQQ